jgi:hypothetical protein
VCTYRCKLLSPWFEPRSGPDGTSVSERQQVADWLKKLGMSDYAERFVENQHDLNYGDTSALSLPKTVNCRE